jgi:hypothetical protein
MSKRTIEISENDYQYLIKLAALMKSQNNRQTAFPLYCIYDKQEDGNSKFINCFFTEKEMNAHLVEYGEDFVAPYTHIRSAAYNEEIRQLMRIIVSLDDLVLPEHDNEAYE